MSKRTFLLLTTVLVSSCGGGGEGVGQNGNGTLAPQGCDCGRGGWAKGLRGRWGLPSS